MTEIALITFGGLPFVLVPKGEFLMGSSRNNQLASKDEKPQHKIEIPYDYWIGKFPITQGQYAPLVEKDSYLKPMENYYTAVWVPAENWDGKTSSTDGHLKSVTRELEEGPNHPVVRINWIQCTSFCYWLNQTYGGELPENYKFSLPTEAEWEKAARGQEGYEWPWGNEFDPKKCNSSDRTDFSHDSTPVGAFSAAGGDSPYGASDMAGNVREWTSSLYRKYPYSALDGRERVMKVTVSKNRPIYRTIRGGSYLSPSDFTRCAFRKYFIENKVADDLGFRIAISPVKFP